MTALLIERECITARRKGGGLVWSDAQGVIIENGNKIVIQTYVGDYCAMTTTMTRKQ